MLSETRAVRLGPANGADETRGALGLRVGFAPLQERAADATTAPRGIDPQTHAPRAVGRAERAAVAGPGDRDDRAGRVLHQDPETVRFRCGVLHVPDGLRRLPPGGRRGAVQELHRSLEIGVLGLARTQTRGETRGDVRQIRGHEASD
jgi:hypothetical protein